MAPVFFCKDCLKRMSTESAAGLLNMLLERIS